MTWITITWPMVAAASLTLGLIELRIGLAEPRTLARLLFSLGALLMAAFSGMELAFMRVQSIAEGAALLPWMDAVMGAVVATLTAFIWVYFGTGRKWLALAPSILYAVGLCADLNPGSDMTYRTITGVRTVRTFGGASFSVLEGVPNPWNAFAYLGGLALLVFVVDASVRLWRSGRRRRALIVGGCVTLFTLTASVHSALVDLGVARTPYLFSWAFLAILVGMVSELNTDVLAATRVAAELKESEHRTELASAAGNLGMWTWDTVQDTVWATQSARSLFGLPETSKLHLEDFTNALHSDDRGLRRQAIQTALENDSQYDVEYRVPLANGENRWISSRGRVEHDAEGKPVLMRGVVLDITARRRIEMELQELRNQLTHSSRVSMMGQLSSALVHELSQPLGAILRNAEAAELFLTHEPLDLEELQAILVDIRRDDQRAADVIDRLRTLLRRGSFTPRAVSVTDLLDNVDTLTRIEFTARKVQLEVAPTTGLPAVLGDPVHLQQVLLNLILNAVDAVQHLPTERRKVTIQAARRGSNEVEFAVTDLGTGIESETLGRLFEPFFTTKPDGMGIGLSISRRIIEAHGGRMWAENNSGAGATFRFMLPLANAAVSA
jgi:two-component system, LuxR family, sensor kinase FixL